MSSSHCVGSFWSNSAEGAGAPGGAQRLAWNWRLISMGMKSRD